MTPRALLRDWRYALPHVVERHVRGPDAATTQRRAMRRIAAGDGVTVGYVQGSGDTPETIVAAHRAIAALLAGHGEAVHLAVKAPPLRFARGPLRAVAEAADAAGLRMMFDAHAPGDADATFAALDDLSRAHPGCGTVLPARWRRSTGDAERLRDADVRLRLVKGEWPDDAGEDEGDTAARYLALARLLAGRAAPVGIATHDPALAEAALTLLRASGTPCELEQLRGLPSRRPRAVARALGVRVRLYIPFGPGWWPYAIDKALARPWLPLWALRDTLGLADAS